jgi:hypothetical protein
MQLGNLTLSDDFVWADEYSWSGVITDVVRTTTGTPIIREFVNETLRPMTLTGDVWMTKDKVEELYTLVNTKNVGIINCIHNGKNYSVVFNTDSGAPITATPVVEVANPTDETLYSVAINLLII